MAERILVVDDEKEIADLIEVYLKNDGYTVYKAYNGNEALRYIESAEIDLAILDVMLPDIDGFRICQKIREKYFYPIIMLTAKVEDSDKIMGLTIGADDYITKPFTMICRVLELETLVNDITLFCIYLITLFVWTRITNNKKLMGKEIEKYFIAFNNHAPSWTIVSSLVFYLAVISDVPKGVLIAIIIASVVLGGSLSWTWYQRLKEVGNSSKV